MTGTAILLLIYGAFVLVGGVMGYIKAASTVSLIMGGVFGLLLILCSALVYKELFVGWITALVVTLALFGFFTYRYFTLFALWPSGVMSLVSVVVLIILLGNRH